MPKLKDIVAVCKSKNAGPFELTIDAVFSDLETFEKVKATGIICPQLFVKLYGVKEDDILFTVYDAGLAFKATLPRLVSAGDGFTAPITLHYLRFSRLAELELHAVVGERTLPHGRLRSRVGKPNGAILRAHVAGRAEVDRQVLHRLGRGLTNKHSPLRKTFLRFVFQDNRGSQRITAGATGA